MNLIFDMKIGERRGARVGNDYDVSPLVPSGR